MNICVLMCGVFWVVCQIPSCPSHLPTPASCCLSTPWSCSSDTQRVHWVDSISAVLQANVFGLHHTELPTWHPTHMHSTHTNVDQITFRHLLTTKVASDVKIFSLQSDENVDFQSCTKGAFRCLNHSLFALKHLKD